MITLQIFESLERNMSYEEATELLGEQGNLISSETAQIEPGIQVMSILTEIFEWTNSDGSAVRLMFKRDRLNEMTQSGLK